MPRRRPEPPLGCAEETALVAEPQQIGCIRDRQVGLTKVLLGQLAARVVQETLERGPFRFQAPLQGASAHLQFAGDIRAPRLTIRQAANDCGAGSAARPGRIQPLEPFAGEPLMNLGEQRVRRWQGRDHIGAGEQQGIRRRIEAQGTFESILVWLKIGRRWKPQFERQRT